MTLIRAASLGGFSGVPTGDQAAILHALGAYAAREPRTTPWMPAAELAAEVGADGVHDPRFEAAVQSLFAVDAIRLMSGGNPGGKSFYKAMLVPLVCLAICLLLVACGDAPASSSSSASQGAAAIPTPTATMADVDEVAPPSAAQVAAGVQATVVFDAATARDKVSAEAVRVYRVRAGIALQDYANALGRLRDKDRELAERPALIADPAWLLRTREAVQVMQGSAARLVAVDVVPPEMAATARLVQQLDGDTRQLAQEYASGIDTASPAALAAAGARTTPLLTLLARTNLELRRGVA